MDKQAEVKESEYLSGIPLDDLEMLTEHGRTPTKLEVHRFIESLGYIKVSPDGEQDVNKWNLTNQQFTGLALIPDLEGEIRTILPCPDVDTPNCDKSPDCDRCALLDQEVHQISSKVSQYLHQLAEKMEDITNEDYTYPKDLQHRMKEIIPEWESMLSYQKENIQKAVAAQLQKCKEIVKG